MIAKPKKYDEVQVNEDFVPIELGGHRGVIMGAEEYTNEETGNISLKVSVDTAKDDKQPEYFTEMYRNDDREGKKWSNQAIKYVSLKDDENCVKMLKAFITSVENSNDKFEFDWNKDWDQLKGKKVGLVFALEEYENRDGELKTIAKLNRFRSIDKVDNIKMPKVKLLNGTFVDYDDYTEGKQDNSADEEIIIDDSMLPF